MVLFRVWTVLVIQPVIDMKLKILIPLFMLLFNSIYAQETSLYIVFNNAADNTYLWTRTIGDTLEIKSFEIKKNIPKEEYLYSLSFKDGKLIKVIKGNLSWGNKGRLTFSYVADKNKKFRVKKDLKGINVFKTDNLEKIEFSSFRRVVEEADKIFILMDENPREKSYNAYQVKP